MDKKQHLEYWQDIMEKRRMPIHDEVNRLCIVLKGIFYEQMIDVQGKERKKQ